MGERDGGAAFPYHGQFTANFGMSLRDYFAAAALTGLIANLTTPNQAATLSYEIADAMLAARTQRSE